MTTATANKTRVSVVIEWENVLLAEATRSMEMLKRLTRQIDEVYAANPAAGSFQVLLLYDNEECSIDDIRQVVEPFFTPARAHCELKLQEAPGRRYYEQKNYGAELARGEIIVFIDSDVIPEDGWLANLLQPFSDAGTKVVCGNTYITANNSYSKSFALFWFFPLRDPKDMLGTRKILFANNLAIRRQTLLDTPFVNVEGTCRGWCVGLSHHLREKGIEIRYQSRARVSHPAPNGRSHFVNRALAEGRDQLLMRRAMGRGGFMRNFPKMCLRPMRTTWKILRYGPRVDLKLTELPAALAVGVTYSTLTISGYIVAQLAPKYAQSHWHV